MISAETNKILRNKRIGGFILQIFIISPLKLERQCIKCKYFSFDFGWYPSLYCTFKNWGERGCLMDKIRQT